MGQQDREVLVEEFWRAFIQKTGRDESTKYIESFAFGMTEKDANDLLELVLVGKKEATSSSLLGYEAEEEEIPKCGDLSIVTDWKGNPKCIIETKEVSIIPFSQITYDICKREGEDECLETWQRGHIKFFKEECREIGHEFNDDMPVVFEDFEMIYKV